MSKMTLRLHSFALPAAQEHIYGYLARWCLDGPRRKTVAVIYWIQHVATCLARVAQTFLAFKAFLWLRDHLSRSLLHGSSRKLMPVTTDYALPPLLMLLMYNLDASTSFVQSSQGRLCDCRRYLVVSIVSRSCRYASSPR